LKCKTRRRGRRSRGRRGRRRRRGRGGRRRRGGIRRRGRRRKRRRGIRTERRRGRRRRRRKKKDEEEECSSCHFIFCPQDTLILYPSICVHVFRVIFPAGDITKTLYAVLVYPMQAACPFHLILLDFIT